MPFIKNNSYLLLVVAVCIIYAIIGLSKVENDVEYEQVVVFEGDTLWGYSVKYANSNVPAEQWIKDIKFKQSYNDYHSGRRRVKNTKEYLI